MKRYVLGIGLALVAGSCATSLPEYGDVPSDRIRSERRVGRSDFRRFRAFRQRGVPIQNDSEAAFVLWFQAVTFPVTGWGPSLPGDPGPPMSSRTRARILLWLSGRVVGEVPDHAAETFVSLDHGKVRLTGQEADAVMRPKPIRTKTVVLPSAADVPGAILDFALFPVNAINVIYFPISGRTVFGSVRQIPVRGRVVHSAGTIIDHFGPDEFHEIMADSGLSIDELDLDDEDLIELREEGYLPLPPAQAPSRQPTEPSTKEPAVPGPAMIKAGGGKGVGR